MASATSTFATSWTRAAGLGQNTGGVIGGTGKSRYGPYGLALEKVPNIANSELIEWLRIRFQDNPALVFSYARELQGNGLGAVGLAARFAPTLRDSLLCLVRYSQLLADAAVFSLKENSDPALFVLQDRTPDHSALQLRDECALAVIAENIRAFGGNEIVLDHIEVRHDRRRDYVSFETFFGCKVIFGARRNAIAIAPDVLDQPNRLDDPIIFNFLIQHLDTEIQKLPGPSSLKAKVLHLLVSRLSDGVPPASNLAMRLGMSERTFYRRLADEGLSYRDVLRDAQLSLAKELLNDSGRSIAEVAFLTGFAEQSTFSRAFKRWVGAAPAQYRRCCRTNSNSSMLDQRPFYGF